MRVRCPLIIAIGRRDPASRIPQPRPGMIWPRATNPDKFDGNPNRALCGAHPKLEGVDALPSRMTISR